MSWAVPRGTAPSSRGGRWRSWPYLAQREPEAEMAFWGALCDEWEARDGRPVHSFVFYLLQADVVPFGAVPLGADGVPFGAADATMAEASTAGMADASLAMALPGYMPEYGSVRKRRIKQFSCLEHRALAHGKAEGERSAAPFKDET